MEQNIIPPALSLSQLRWILVSFCLYALFHLLPFILLSDLVNEILWATFWARAILVFVSIGAISIAIGYRARRMVLLESALGAVLYILTIKLLVPSCLGVPTYLQNTYFVLECIILGFAFAFGGAGIGYWLKIKNQSSRRMYE